MTKISEGQTGMADKNVEEAERPAAKSEDLEYHALQLQRLAKLLSVVTKGRLQSKTDFGKQIENALKLAEQVSWPEILSSLRRELEASRTQQDTAIQTRREKLHQAARAANTPAEMGARSDRVDVFRIDYEGSVAVVTFGGVMVERLKESDGEKIFTHVHQLRAKQEQSPFNREAFFKQLKVAYANCRRSESSGDDFIPVRELHREVILERARRSDTFRRNPEPKNIPQYPLYQFVFDLARFIQGGVAVADERLVTQVPSMRESRDTIFIPNLGHPLATETAAARLAIKPA